MAYKIIPIAVGFTTVLLYGRAPTKRGREKKGVSRLAR